VAHLIGPDFLEVPSAEMAARVSASRAGANFHVVGTPRQRVMGVYPARVAFFSFVIISAAALLDPFVQACHSQSFLSWGRVSQGR